MRLYFIFIFPVQHFADHLRLDGAWRQSNKHNNFPITPTPTPSLWPLSPHSQTPLHLPFSFPICGIHFFCLMELWSKSLWLHIVCLNVSHTSVSWILIRPERSRLKSKSGGGRRKGVGVRAGGEGSVVVAVVVQTARNMYFGARVFSAFITASLYHCLCLSCHSPLSPFPLKPVSYGLSFLKGFGG